MEMKKRTGALILQKLSKSFVTLWYPILMHSEDAVPRKRGVPSKMQYTEYADRIALKFGVLLEKWPLQKFTAPGNFSSLATVRIIFNAFNNDVTKFRVLDNDQ